MLTVVKKQRYAIRFISESTQWWLYSKHMDTMNGTMVSTAKDVPHNDPFNSLSPNSNQY